MVSPARALQDLVQVGWSASPDDDGRRWSPRATLALAGGISLLVWTAVAMGVAALR